MQLLNHEELDALLSRIDPSYELDLDQMHQLGEKYGANIVRAHFRNGDESVIRYGHNARTNAGAQYIAQHLFSAAATPLQYLALSSATLTPATGDTTLTSEITTTGLGRKIATYGTYVAPASLGANASCNLQASYINNGGSAVSVNSVGLFSASSGGTMAFEANLTAGNTLNPGDSVQITYTLQT